MSCMPDVVLTHFILDSSRRLLQLTFSGAETLALFEEGTPPGFNCMNEHFGMTFVKGIAEKTIAYGTLKSEKVCVNPGTGKK